MIHTFKMFFELDYQEVQDLQKKFNIKYTEFNEHFAGSYAGVTMSIILCKDGKWRLYMVVDAIELLGKPDINEADCGSIETELKYILSDIFGHSAYYRNHVLLRIDYRYDVIIKNKNDRQLLLTLYKKLTKSHRFQKKYLGKLKDGVYVPYKTTVYHASKSVESIVYDKERERTEKGMRVKDYEKDVLRFEVHLKRDHLYYSENKKDNCSRKRKLAEYMKKEVYQEYFQKYLLHIYYPGSFCKIDEARKRLRQSTLTNTNKLKLIDFLKQVSSHSVDTPLFNKDKKKRISKGTYNRRLAMLKEIDINPILIPKNYSPKAPSILKNPLDDFPHC